MYEFLLIRTAPTQPTITCLSRSLGASSSGRGGGGGRGNAVLAKKSNLGFLENRGLDNRRDCANTHNL